MSAKNSGPFTVGAKAFDPEALVQDEVKLKIALLYLEKDDIGSAIINYFSLPGDDDYVYHAIASVKLAQVQQAVQQGHQFHLNDWYKDDNQVEVVGQTFQRALQSKI